MGKTWLRGKMEGRVKGTLNQQREERGRDGEGSRNETSCKESPQIIIPATESEGLFRCTMMYTVVTFPSFVGQ